MRTNPCCGRPTSSSLDPRIVTHFAVALQPPRDHFLCRTSRVAWLAPRRLVVLLSAARTVQVHHRRSHVQRALFQTTRSRSFRHDAPPEEWSFLSVGSAFGSLPEAAA